MHALRIGYNLTTLCCLKIWVFRSKWRSDPGQSVCYSRRVITRGSSVVGAVYVCGHGGRPTISLSFVCPFLGLFLASNEQRQCRGIATLGFLHWALQLLSYQAAQVQRFKQALDLEPHGWWAAKEGGWGAAGQGAEQQVKSPLRKGARDTVMSLDCW